tara:strand:+ start:132 stop:977 length:846 start_codon:yes stop_codon:yes gene_type:complete
MNTEEFQNQLKICEKIKKEKTDICNYNINDLYKLPILTGAINLKFNNLNFNMMNINNDDGVVLKYFWRNEYEPFSLNIWHKITRNNLYFFDIGAHTGIYSIIGNLQKNNNQIISIEPYFLNYARLVTNLRLNNYSSKNCILSAISNEDGEGIFQVNSNSYYLTQGAKLSDTGNFKIMKKKLDNFKLDKDVGGIKIDTEGHELEVIEGGLELIKKFLPPIIIEINKKSFDNCAKILRNLGYNFYLIQEKLKNLDKISEFNSDYIKSEGVNCLAVVNDVEMYK